MARTRLSAERLKESKQPNIGRVIIFVEGQTEKYYFEYFANILNKSKYTDIEVVLEAANGNARAVLNYAKLFLSNDENNRKYSFFGKYLVFDCDAPKEIQSVIIDSSDFSLLLTNYLFETWLLMHFEEVTSVYSKRKIYRRLSSHISTGYKKGRKGLTRAIILTGDIERAIENAKQLEARFTNLGMNYLVNVIPMNPYTTVHSLIEQFLIEIS